MAINQYTKFVQQIGGGTTIDIDIGGSGGILLKLKLYNAPYTYFNINTDTEQVKSGNIYAIIADSATFRSLIGQIEIVPVPDSVVVPFTGSWEWEHPDADAFRSSQILSKLRPHTAFALQPDAMMLPGSKLRILAQWDPEIQTVHNLCIEAEVMVFD